MGSDFRAALARPKVSPPSRAPRRADEDDRMTWHRISVARDEAEQISELLGAALERNRR